jgi:hypothetical protein
MLQGVKAKIDELGGFRVSINPKNPAMVMELVDIKLKAWEELGG